MSNSSQRARPLTTYALDMVSTVTAFRHSSELFEMVVHKLASGSSEYLAPSVRAGVVRVPSPKAHSLNHSDLREADVKYQEGSFQVIAGQNWNFGLTLSEQRKEYCQRDDFYESGRQVREGYRAYSVWVVLNAGGWISLMFSVRVA